MQPLRGDLLPQIIFTLDVPTRPADLAKRWHNKYAKEAARYMIERHHEENVPKHFKRSARSRYGYRPRDPKYVRKKQRRWKQGGMDLVKTGRTRRYMTNQYKLRLGGTADKGTLTATLILRFPFKGGTGKWRRPAGPRGARAQITIQTMIGEMQSFAADEPPQLLRWFEEEYWRQVENHRSSRKRTRIS